MSNKEVELVLTPEPVSCLGVFLTLDPVATVACFVAFLALVTSAWQASQQRKHNRLSVRPFVSGFSLRGKQKDMAIGFKNMGLGSAIIHEITYTVDGENININKTSDFSKVFQKLGLSHLNSEFICCVVGKYAVLAPSESVVLIELQRGSYDESEANLIANQLSKILIHASYQSMYKENFTTKSTAP